MNANAYSEPALWRKSLLPHHATCGSSGGAEAAIEFGRFRVLLRQRWLLADGVPVEVGTRAFDLLLVLLEADGALVTKRELLSRVWPGMVVSVENLKVQISALRKALGADRDLIRTEFGRGYRFIGMLRSNTTAIRRAVSANPACHLRHRLFAMRSLCRHRQPRQIAADRSAAIDGAQLDEAIQAASRIAPSFDSAATLAFRFTEGLIVGVQ
jgi:DNA-binding winged helix-turn-helix (wHTH) protein